MANSFNWSGTLVLTGFAALAVACSPVQAPSTADKPAPLAVNAPVAGWYVQDAARILLQPCGAPNGLAVLNGEELRRRAGVFGLQPGDPIYVRVHGTLMAGEFRLSSVEQFGSPVPIQDCPMSGTMIQ